MQCVVARCAPGVNSLLLLWISLLGMLDDMLDGEILVFDFCKMYTRDTAHPSSIATELV